MSIAAELDVSELLAVNSAVGMWFKQNITMFKFGANFTFN